MAQDTVQLAGAICFWVWEVQAQMFHGQLGDSSPWYSLSKALDETLTGDPVQGARRLQQATKTGAWLIMQQSTINGTELGAQEW